MIRAGPAGEAGGGDEGGWQQALDRELAAALARGERAVGDRLEKEFERTLILRALSHTGGHRMEALANKQVDMAWYGGFTFVQANMRSGGKALPLVQREVGG